MPEEWQVFLENAGVFWFSNEHSGGADQLFSVARSGSIRSLGLVLLRFSPNLGPIWVQLTGSKSSLEDQERAVSTVEIQ